jgi:hypothetical protein
MEVDLTPEDIRAQFKTQQHTILSLHVQGRRNKGEYVSLKNEYERLLSKMGWREKYCLGYFGGSRLVVRQLKIVKSSLGKKRDHLISIDKKLKIETDNLSKAIKDYAAKNSEEYKKLITENDDCVSLYNASALFYNFLLSAKKIVNDALLLTSWEALLEHPSAREGLDKFRDQTTAYQGLAKSYELSLEVDLLKGANLTDFIRFSSESVAMDGFDQIMTRVSDTMDYCESAIAKNKENKDTIVEEIKKLVMAP